MKYIIMSLLLSLGIFTAQPAETNGKLENEAVAWSWHFVDGMFRPVRLDDKLNGTSLYLTGECFQLELGDGTIVRASDLKVDGRPEEMGVETRQ